MLLDRNLVTAASAGRSRARLDALAPVGWNAIKPRRSAVAARSAFGFIAAIFDAAAIVLSAIIAGTFYHAIVYELGVQETFVRLGAVIAVLFVAPNALRKEYRLDNYLASTGHFRRSLVLWNIAFLTALVIAFLTKTSTDISRGTFVIFYVAGIGCLTLTRVALAHVLQERTRRGQIAMRRIFLVGFEADMQRFTSRYNETDLGIQVIAGATLRAEDTLEEDLALAAASARMLRPDDVFIVVPWSHKETIDACINAFLRVPASIHLGPERVFERFDDIRIEQTGPIASLSLVRRPLSLFERGLKRCMDIAGALFGLILLSPLFLLIALAIRLDTPGPVLFRQRRYGFNQEAFRIFKFRSMTTMEDDRYLQQATKGDVRITRVGAFLRRWNFDELPQLVNVLRGEMSLVGPRPHALAHDQLFERNIAFYARRHNVKPGMTGWAQVHGLRGDIDEDRIRGRVEHDLYYIDNWSFWLDLKILALTVFSRKAYRNAF